MFLTGKQKGTEKKQNFKLQFTMPKRSRPPGVEIFKKITQNSV